MTAGRKQGREPPRGPDHAPDCPRPAEPVTWSEMRLPWPALLTLAFAAGVPLSARAAPGAGTIADPIVVDAFPYVAAGTTVAAPSDAIDFYSCAAAIDESGPEVVYRFELPAPARITAWVEGDGGTVDVDIHLLDDLALSGAVASSCAARGNVMAEADMAVGSHYAVVDSFQGTAQAGPYVLHLEAIGDGWIERTLADGVVWRARRFADLSGAQVVHEVVVDTTAAGVELRAVAASGCQTVGALGAQIGAIAGINGGYFDTGGGCPPVSLLKSDGVLVATNGATRGAFGLGPNGDPMVAIVAAGQDWPAARQAHGGGPVLVEAGVAHHGGADWADQGFTNAGFLGTNPRTLVGYDGAARSHLVTVDGRHAHAAGMSLDDEAALAVGAEIGLDNAVNLDGGGSTTMWIAGATPSGVVNYPSDAGPETPTHDGSRPCSGGFFVLAPPYNHPPRFQTEPVTDAQAGASYSYDADAIDLDVTDTISYSLELGPDGMSIDPDTGVVSYAPTAASAPSADVTLRASDNRGAYTDQSYSLLIEGGTGAAGAGGAGAGGAGTGGEAAGAGTAGLVPSGEAAADAGCGCRLDPTGEPAPRPQPFGALLLIGAGLLRRRCSRRNGLRRCEPPAGNAA